jgi:hypothetical protein
MPKRREVAINGSGGAFVDISATIPCRYVTIQEIVGKAEGLDYKTNEAGDNFATTHQLTPQDVLELGNKVAIQGGRGSVIGWPADNPRGRAADVITKARSSSVNATTVIINEYE